MGNKDDMKLFLNNLKNRKGRILQTIRAVDNSVLIYYREYGSYPTDIKIRRFGDE